ncbi:MAG: bifunctional phosphopantothenoylcysteine decarboxylase/phosphopantothenate--cysteine ligase CoaBC [Muribaculaceae bacterium]|nr:bifunctional phosphopantothenoylcysteine decarboxylase/phosphopantothenate--cysteine ligase CoaBC [Muribaculaceae bacterium]MBQ7204587.1 bifunctional phosphopantothenoylcysteine decarboxylase/phosphopantothenate--cysteine ligase CoaBC [Muribaculaceae bacterium]
MLKGKNIILGITGGIAAYKCATLTRLLVKAGAEVQVIMTPNAKQFIQPLTLSTLSGKPVISEFFTANTGQWNSHVDLGLWADALIIAPATASTIGKMANGVADNMLVTTYLSAKAPVFVAPAMDLDMMRHPSTVRNLELLRGYGNHIIEPAEGELASHLVGKGRMEEPENIVKVLDAYFAASEDLQGKRVLITAGPTVEKIDPVRFISNFSSGKMGFALAEECACRGAQVTLVAGPVSLKTEHPNIERIDVTTAVEMHDTVMAALPQTDAIILCAAVADYRVENVAESKIKREKTENPVIQLTPNPDIARAVGQAKRADQVSVGFALETDNENVNAQGKLERKNLNFIVMNSLRDKNAGFQVDTNKVTIFTDKGEIINGECKSKRDVAHDIVDVLFKYLSKHEK